jgi:hypothetical protein
MSQPPAPEKADTAMHDYTAGFEDEEAIILSSSDGELFKLPKVHLKVHSSVFHGMFDGSHDECAPLGLEEASGVLRIILSSIFQQPVEISDKGFIKTMSGVLKACRKYEMMPICHDVLNRAM